ncbi:serine hydrolase [Paraflavitalea pollutisoli]|uniref:serine hydrolase n=1 Tax=Paraflavitalea pollutisoli TaxID=3034143 RepID=UPI0023EB21AB|nr:serine hydrolase [Paraflavitalea sp. H1-2-19X]
MRNTKTACIFTIIYLIVTSCHSTNSRLSPQQLADNIKARLDKVPGHFGVAYYASWTGPVLVHADSVFHAASTMKTPVMIEVYNQAKAGRFSLNDSLTIKNEFYSIVDSSVYSLNAADDSEQQLYSLIGTKRSIYQLVYDMIIKSSNLATNMMIELVGAKNVTNTMRNLSAHSIQVLRGVEDSKAYQQGLNNTTTANDLLAIYDHLAAHKVVDSASSAAMIGILLDQQFNEIIPARLPGDVKVAHKTGNISGVQHDSGIVFLPDGRFYAIVLLSKDLTNEQAGIDALADVSKMIYDYAVGQP